MKQNLINEGLEELKRNLLLMNYDLNKTSTENSINEQPGILKTISKDAKMFGRELSASAIKDIEGAIKDAAPEMRELKLTDGRTLNPKSANFSNELKDAIKDGKIQGTELGYTRLKILAKTKNPELVNAITKEIGTSKNIKTYLSQAEKDGKDLVNALGEYKTKGIQDLSREEKELIVKYFQESKAGETVVTGTKLTDEVKNELLNGRGTQSIPEGFVVTASKTPAEAAETVGKAVVKDGVEASRAEKIGKRLGSLSAKTWDFIKNNSHKLNWKTMLKYGLIAASVYGAYKWLFSNDNDMPPPACIGGNDNFKASIDGNGNVVYVSNSSNKYTKGILMNMDYTCEDRATGRKGKWSCTETAKEPTVATESVDEIYDRFSFLLQEETETFGNVTINWDEQSTGGGDGGDSKTSFPIPEELKDSEGVIKFQTWMEENHKGWYKGSKPIDGIFGPQTKAAWDNKKYKDEYLKSSGTTTTTTTTTSGTTTSGTTTPQAAPTNVQNNVESLTSDQQEIVGRYIAKGYKDLGMGKRIALDIAPTYTEFNLKSQLGTKKDYYVYLKNSDVVPKTVESLAKTAIKEEKITRASCRHAIKTFYLSYDTGIEVDEETFNQLKLKVQRCRKQYDNFNDLNITNNKLITLYNLPQENKYYISDKRTMGENNSKTQLKSLVKENLIKVKETNTKKMLSEEKIIKTRYSILIEGRKLKTESDFRKLSDDIINETIYLNSQNFNKKLIQEQFGNFLSLLGDGVSQSPFQYFKEQALKWIMNLLGVEHDSFLMGAIIKAFGNIDFQDYPKLFTDCKYFTKEVAKAFAEQSIDEIQKRTVGQGLATDMIREILIEMLDYSKSGQLVEDKLAKFICPSLSKVGSKMKEVVGDIKNKITTNTAPEKPVA